MKITQLRVLAGILLAGLGQSALPADDQIVIDDLTPVQLRAEITKIQTEFYRVFNASNTVEDLAIVCRDYLPTNSNIKREACEPKFVTDRRARNAADSQSFTDALLSPAALQTDLSHKFEELTEAINALAAENQYFRELNTILSVLRERLEEITK